MQAYHGICFRLGMGYFDGDALQPIQRHGT